MTLIVKMVNIRRIDHIRLQWAVKMRPSSGALAVKHDVTSEAESRALARLGGYTWLQQSIVTGHSHRAHVCRIISFQSSRNRLRASTIGIVLYRSYSVYLCSMSRYQSSMSLLLVQTIRGKFQREDAPP